MSTPLSAETFTPLDDPDPATPGDPLVRLRYHYGQLLGAEDFSTEQRYFVLRRRLHNALLHGVGTVWGLRVSAVAGAEPATLQLHCAPGLAIDPLGREVFLPEAVCLDVSGLAATPFWQDLSPPPSAAAELPLEGEAEGEEEAGDPPAESRVRRVYVLLYYRACLSAPVPAVVPPCTETADAMVHSRVQDSYRLCLAAAPPADPAEPIRSLPLGQGPADPRSRLLDLILDPPLPLARFWSGQEEAPLLLAVVDLEPVGDPPAGMTLVGEVDNGVRAILPHLQAVASLALECRLDGAPAAAAFQVLGVSAGPGANAGSMTLRVSTSAAPLQSTLTDPAVRVLRLDPATGWTEAPVVNRTALATGIEIGIAEAWDGPTTYQLCLAGSGPAAIADSAGRLLAGVLGEPLPAGVGRDVYLSAHFDPAP